MLRKLGLGVMALSLAVAGGSLHMFIADPSASTDPAAKGAVAIVDIQGCAEPRKAVLKAVAKGMVDGVERTIPLEVVRLEKSDRVALKGDMVRTGDWTVVVTANWSGTEWTASAALRNGSVSTRSKTLRT